MFLLLFFQQLIASLTHVVSKSLTESVQSPVILLFRSAIAAAFFLSYILLNRKKVRKFELRDLPVLLILGLINIPINQFLFLTAIHLTTAPNVALAYALSPAFVMILAVSFFGEKSSLIKTIGVITAFAGTSLILFEKGLNLSSGYFTGNMLALLASLSWAFYTILGKKFSIKYGAVYSTALSMIVGFILYLPIFFLLDLHYSVSAIMPVDWVEIAFLGLFSSAVSYVLWYYALKKIDATKVSVFNNIQVVLTTVLSIFLFHTMPTGYFIAGGLLIVGGVVITQRG